MILDILVETMIVRMQYLPPVGQEFALDGSASLDVVYL